MTAKHVCNILKLLGLAPLTEPLRFVVIGNAIKIVFPEATHRWCMWHVMQNCRKHLGVRCNWGEIYCDLLDVLHDSFSVEEFEGRWKQWEWKFGISDTPWVITMYAQRSRWCPVYFKSDFWAGMSSTQRSEGMNHYFKGYVDANTTLSDFVEKYAKAVCRRIAEEDKDEFSGMDRHDMDTSLHAFDPIYEKLYTRLKYLEFHEELKEFGHTAATKGVETEHEIRYDVMVKSLRVGWTRQSNFKVVYVKQSGEVRCECKRFEFRGIMCSHALRVFWAEDITEVPDKYVLNRWRKDRARKYLTHIYPEAAIVGQVSDSAKRFHELKSICDDMSVSVMNDEELHKDVVVMINKIRTHIKNKTGVPNGIGSFERGTVGKVFSRLPPCETACSGGLGLIVEERDVLDPIDRRGRGKSRAKRLKSAAEIRAGIKTRSSRGSKREVTNDGSPSASTPPTRAKVMNNSFATLGCA